MGEKFYVITHGPSKAYVATVHRDTCPMVPRLKNAHVWNRNPFDDDKWNHYQKCKRCWGDKDKESE